MVRKISDKGHILRVPHSVSHNDARAGFHGHAQKVRELIRIMLCIAVENDRSVEPFPKNLCQTVSERDSFPQVSFVSQHNRTRTFRPLNGRIARSVIDYENIAHMTPRTLYDRAYMGFFVIAGNDDTGFQP
jgi:hypothetical protein